MDDQTIENKIFESIKKNGEDKLLFFSDFVCFGDKTGNNAGE